jgi:hypothetical protein
VDDPLTGGRPDGAEPPDPDRPEGATVGPDRDPARLARAVVAAGRHLIRVLSMADGLFDRGERHYLLGSAVSRLGRLIDAYLDRVRSDANGEIEKNPYYYLMPAWVGDRWQSIEILQRVVVGIRGRWGAEEDEYFKELSSYYRGWSTTEGGEPLEPPPGRKCGPPPQRPPLEVLPGERAQLEVSVPHFELAHGDVVFGHQFVQPDEDVRTRGSGEEENEPRDERLYDRYVEGVPLAKIIEELRQHGKDEGWEVIATPPGIWMAVHRFAERHWLPKPVHGQKTNHRRRPPGHTTSEGR